MCGLRAGKLAGPFRDGHPAGRDHALETDAAITRDGVAVLHHDLALNPNHTRNGKVRWLGIARTHPRHEPGRGAGLRHRPHQARQQVRPAVRRAKPIDGTRVPRLADLFEMVSAGQQQDALRHRNQGESRAPRGHAGARALCHQLVAEMRAAMAWPRVQIMSFDWRTLQVIQRIAPEIPTVYLTAQQRWMDIRATRARHIGVDRQLPVQGPRLGAAA
ncbi:MAG: hypothetical protein IPJ08_14170 [Burkholderiales bacterium]|nr:hypothetical protein [Burkholderiales bacterium]